MTAYKMFERPELALGTGGVLFVATAVGSWAGSIKATLFGWKDGCSLAGNLSAAGAAAGLTDVLGAVSWVCMHFRS